MKSKNLYKMPVLLSASLVSGLAFAGRGPMIGDLTHSPTLDAVGVPLLGGVGLLLLAALLGLFGFRVLKSDQAAGSKWLLAACLTTALASGSGGIKLMSDAYADIADIAFEDENGATITLYEGDVSYDNGGNCGPPQGGSEGLIVVANATETLQFLTDVTIADGPCTILEQNEFLLDGNGGNGAGTNHGICEDLPLAMEPDDSCDIAVCCTVTD